MPIRFAKVHGTGNDYLVVNTVDQTFGQWAELARWACRPHLGIGADGLVVYAHEGRRRFRLRCFNPDGSVSTLSANAMRCCAEEIRHRYSYRDVTLLVGRSSYPALVGTGDVRVHLGRSDAPAGPHRIAGRTVHHIRSLSQDAVIVVPEVDEVDLGALGPLVRHHPLLGPDGANVTVAEITGDDRLRVRTFERGVEGETLSSGSGAASAAIVAHHLGLVDGTTVRVANASGRTLTVDLLGGEHPYEEVWLTGEAVRVFTGELDWADVVAQMPVLPEKENAR